jgi:hypothetical protein
VPEGCSTPIEVTTLAALTSIVIALATVGIKIILTWASRARLVSQGKPRLGKEDWLVWSDLVVTGGLAMLFLILTKNNDHSLSAPLIVTLSAIIFTCSAVLPGIVNDHVYDGMGTIVGWRAVWAANAGGFLILVVAVALGAEIHG